MKHLPSFILMIGVPAAVNILKICCKLKSFMIFPLLCIAFWTDPEINSIPNVAKYTTESLIKIPVKGGLLFITIWLLVSTVLDMVITLSFCDKNKLTYRKVLLTFIMNVIECVVLIPFVIAFGLETSLTGILASSALMCLVTLPQFRSVRNNGGT